MRLNTPEPTFQSVESVPGAADKTEAAMVFISQGRATHIRNILSSHFSSFTWNDISSRVYVCFIGDDNSNFASLFVNVWFPFQL